MAPVGRGRRRRINENEDTFIHIPIGQTIQSLHKMGKLPTLVSNLIIMIIIVSEMQCMSLVYILIVTSGYFTLGKSVQNMDPDTQIIMATYCL